MKTNSIIRIAAVAVLLAVSLCGCVVVPYGHGPYHPCGYHRCR
jgi:hypothetical protein